MWWLLSYSAFLEGECCCCGTVSVMSCVMVFDAVLKTNFFRIPLALSFGVFVLISGGGGFCFVMDPETLHLWQKSCVVPSWVWYCRCMSPYSCFLVFQGKPTHTSSEYRALVGLSHFSSAAVPREIHSWNHSNSESLLLLAAVFQETRGMSGVCARLFVFQVE